MSFRCDRCSVAYPNPDHPEERRPTPVVTAARSRTYHDSRDPNNVTLGWETAGSAVLCSGCAATHVPPTIEHSEKESSLPRGTNGQQADAP